MLVSFDVIFDDSRFNLSRLGTANYIIARVYARKDGLHAYHLHVFKHSFVEKRGRHKDRVFFSLF